MRRKGHDERHQLGRIGWLRAAVLGANDGVISTASLMTGVAAAASHAPREILISGLAGLFAGALSMAVGEFVSVSSQGDTEQAALRQERSELKSDPEAELRELAEIYVQRGLEPGLAGQVAEQLSRRDALAAHARDELGITDIAVARPIQAASASASSFSVGALVPILAALLGPPSMVLIAIPAASLLGLAGLGALGAVAGGAKPTLAAVRVVLGGAVAMAATGMIGAVIGRSV
jgi:VIT1/CCC1 family predicted Fe2+/Mn2+ transporter